MNLLRSRWSTMCVAVGLGCGLVHAVPARAQTFVEVAGGWNVPADGSSGASNIRASLGWEVAPNLRWRIDAYTSRFDVTPTVTNPCPSIGCGVQSERLNALTFNGLVNVDPRGVFYVVGGAGLYDVETQTTELHFGVSAGAGIAVPLASHVGVVVEARWHELFGPTSGPTWLMPITLGLRIW